MSILHFLISIYAIATFCVSLWRPKVGFFMLIPIIGLGFAESTLLKGVVEIAAIVGSCMAGIWKRKDMVISKDVLAALLAVTAFVVWIILRALILHDGFQFWVGWSVKRILAPMLLTLYAIYVLRSKEDVYEALIVLFGFGTLTALVGILQYVPGSDIFWSLRTWLGVPLEIGYQITERVRVTGVSSYVVPLAYQLLSLVPLALPLVIVQWKRRRTRISFAVMALIMGACLVLTFIKAGIGAAAFGSVVVLLLLLKAKRIKGKTVAGWAALFVVAIGVIVAIPGIRSNVFRLGGTTYERIPITIAAVKVFSTNPLGAGYAYNQKVADIYSQIADIPRSSEALVRFPHNIVLDLGVILGFPALILACIFYGIFFRTLWRVYRRADPDTQLLAIGLIGSFVAYLFNVMFHNNSPFFGDTFNWILIGVALALASI